jgi:hypothetical protein
LISDLLSNLSNNRRRRRHQCLSGHDGNPQRREVSRADTQISKPFTGRAFERPATANRPGPDWFAASLENQAKEGNVGASARMLSHKTKYALKALFVMSEE